MRWGLVVWCLLGNQLGLINMSIVRGFMGLSAPTATLNENTGVVARSGIGLLMGCL